MGELGLNKILGALLATALGLFGLKTLSDVVFAHGGEGHGEEHAEKAALRPPREPGGREGDLRGRDLRERDWSRARCTAAGAW